MHMCRCILEDQASYLGKHCRKSPLGLHVCLSFTCSATKLPMLKHKRSTNMQRKQQRSLLPNSQSHKNHQSIHPCFFTSKYSPYHFKSRWQRIPQSLTPRQRGLGQGKSWCSFLCSLHDSRAKTIAPRPRRIKKARGCNFFQNIFTPEMWGWCPDIWAFSSLVKQWASDGISQQSTEHKQMTASHSGGGSKPAAEGKASMWC